MERAFQIAAAVLIAAAAVFYVYGNIDGVFISIVLGCLSYFLSVRAQVKERLAEREARRAAIEESEPEPGVAAADAEFAGEDSNQIRPV